MTPRLPKPGPSAEAANATPTADNIGQQGVSSANGHGSLPVPTRRQRNARLTHPDYAPRPQPLKARGPAGESVASSTACSTPANSNAIMVSNGQHSGFLAVLVPDATHPQLSVSSGNPGTTSRADETQDQTAPRRVRVAKRPKVNQPAVSDIALSGIHPRGNTGRNFSNALDVNTTNAVVHFEPPENDDTIPTTDHKEQEIVKTLVDAIYHVDPPLPNAKPYTVAFQARWINRTHYKPAHIEMLAWEIVQKTIKIHTEGWTEPIYDESLMAQILTTKHMKFAERMTSIESLLKGSKDACESALKREKIWTIIGTAPIMFDRLSVNKKQNKTKAKRLEIAKAVEAEIEKLKRASGDSIPAAAQLNDTASSSVSTAAVASADNAASDTVQDGLRRHEVSAVDPNPIVADGVNQTSAFETHQAKTANAIQTSQEMAAVHGQRFTAACDNAPCFPFSAVLSDSQSIITQSPSDGTTTQPPIGFNHPSVCSESGISSFGDSFDVGTFPQLQQGLGDLPLGEPTTFLDQSQCNYPGHTACGTEPSFVWSDRLLGRAAPDLVHHSDTTVHQTSWIQPLASAIGKRSRDHSGGEKDADFDGQCLHEAPLLKKARVSKTPRVPNARSPKK
ncbi:uncharacterized protein EI97DRAFT_440411 [Westerdykella ornata]|uniref:Uncharacterized protein n=1 Tax=Westerdykella ornata TaxID=318751 RepID=A0A6A6JR98_WESOR|nr:uncharacterized protein EI97DRAFT_440411 [Westerdykella ornata]KAF2278907.1 hypothetical protein EI97DRAFT_440411 [Westerdykella ornata]